MFANYEAIADVLVDGAKEELQAKKDKALDDKYELDRRRYDLIDEIASKMDEFNIKKKREIVPITVKLTTVKGGC